LACGAASRPFAAVWNLDAAPRGLVLFAQPLIILRKAGRSDAADRSNAKRLSIRAAKSLDRSCKRLLIRFSALLQRTV
jgi:hypothetical protein